MERIKTAVFGTGFVGRVHLEGIRRLGFVDIYAIGEPQVEKAQQLAAEFGVEKTAADYREILDDPKVQAVHVCTPNFLHFPIAKAALEAGKHVICEKPMAMHAGEAREMALRAASRPDQLAIIDHELRFNPTWRRMKELVDSGFLGELHHINLLISSGFRHSALRPWNWWSQKSAGGGLLGALGSHVIDAIHWIFG